ncbi:hypothetical protein AC1031_011956 [Aphanomyces cochlioides]|nr:hypothetical protein AC1031_011956 [Aphanomyces cochlioides]
MMPTVSTDGDPRDKKRVYMRRKAQMYRARDKEAAAALREQAYALECDLQWLQRNREAGPWREVAQARLVSKNEAIATNETLRHQVHDCAEAIQDMLAQVDARDAPLFQDNRLAEGFRSGPTPPVPPPAAQVINPPPPVHTNRIHLPPIRQALSGHLNSLPPPSSLRQTTPSPPHQRNSNMPRDSFHLSPPSMDLKRKYDMETN